MHIVWDRLARNCIPCLGQIRAKLYTLSRTERTKTIPCPAAHPRISHIREYPRNLCHVTKLSFPFFLSLTVLYLQKTHK